MAIETFDRYRHVIFVRCHPWYLRLLFIQLKTFIDFTFSSNPRMDLFFDLCFTYSYLPFTIYVVPH